MHEVDVVVIGAGAAGIAAARRLAGSGLATVVLEARERLGGRAFTLDRDGMALDLGCGWLHSAEENEWVAIARASGFTIDKTPPPWTRRRGGNLDLSEDEERDLRATLDRFYARLEEAASEQPDRPAATLLEPGSRWSPLIGAMSTWINAVELDRVSVRDWSNYRETGTNWRVAEGYGALVAACGAGLDLRLATPATLIDHAGPRLRIATARGDVSARAAIVAVPTGIIADEALRFAPALPDKLAAAAALPLGADDKLFLALERPQDFPSERRVFGAVDTTATGSYHLRPFGRPVIEGYFGGALARELEQGGEAAFVDFAAAQLVRHFGADIRKRLSLVAVSSWSSDPFARGSYSYAKPGHAGARATIAAAVDGRLFFAGEACSTHDFSTAHGAYRTGLAAAEAAMAALAPAQ